jgi:small GTP-binding protein
LAAKSSIQIISKVMPAKQSGVKAVFVGDSGSGKTSIIQAQKDGTFRDKFSPTVAGSYVPLILPWSGSQVKFAIWDTAGQEVYQSIAPMYFHDAKCAIVVFDLTERASFDHVNDWISRVEDAAHGAAIILCGNKRDQEDQRKTTFSEATERAQDLNASYIEVSAKTRSGLDELFELVATRVGELYPGEMRSGMASASGEANLGERRKCC